VVGLDAEVEVGGGHPPDLQAVNDAVSIRLVAENAIAVFTHSGGQVFTGIVIPVIVHRGGGGSHVVVPLGFLLGGEVVTPSPCIGR